MTDSLGIELPLFELFGIITKWLIYLGVAAIIGGTFMLMVSKPQQRVALQSYMTAGACMGILAVGVNFFIQVGAFAEEGLAGMCSPMMMDMLWQSVVGESVIWRIVGFTLALTALLLTRFVPKQSNAGLIKGMNIALLSLAILTLAYSFTLIGHSTDIGITARLLIALHVITVGAWIGALYPLWSICSQLPLPSLKERMDNFGQQAQFIVAIVVMSGTGLLLLFLQSPMEIFTSNYGQAILVKLLIISVILLIAALHKFYLVPKLIAMGATQGRRLKSSIGVEIVVAGLILATTAILSSVLGPASMM